MGISTTITFGAAGSPVSMNFDWPDQASFDAANKTFLDALKTLVTSSPLSADPSAQSLVFTSVTTIDGTEVSNISITVSVASASGAVNAIKGALHPHMGHKR